MAGDILQDLAASRRPWSERMREQRMPEDEIYFLSQQRAQRLQTEQLLTYQARVQRTAKTLRQETGEVYPTEPPVQGRRFNIFNLFEVFNALEYPITNLAKAISEGDDFGEVVQHMFKGLTLQEKTSGDDLLESLGMTQGKGRTALGLLVDIAANPLSWVVGPSSLTKLGKLGMLKSLNQLDNVKEGSKIAKLAMEAVPGARTLQEAVAAIKPLGNSWAEQATLGQRAMFTTFGMAPVIKGEAAIKGMGKLGSKLAASRAGDAWIRFWGGVKSSTAKAIIGSFMRAVDGGLRQNALENAELANIMTRYKGVPMPLVGGLKSVGGGPLDVAEVLIRSNEDPLVAEMLEHYIHDRAAGVTSLSQSSGAAAISKVRKVAERLAVKSRQADPTVVPALAGSMRGGFSEEDAAAVVEGALNWVNTKLGRRLKLGDLPIPNVHVRQALLQRREDITFNPYFVEEFFGIMLPGDDLKAVVKGFTSGQGTTFATHHIGVAFDNDANQLMKEVFANVVNKTKTYQNAYGTLASMIEAGRPMGEIFEVGFRLATKDPAALLAQSPEMYAFYQSVIRTANGGKLPAKFSITSQLLKRADVIQEGARTMQAMRDLLTAGHRFAWDRVSGPGKEFVQRLQQRILGRWEEGVSLGARSYRTLARLIDGDDTIQMSKATVKSLKGQAKKDLEYLMTAVESGDPKSIRQLVLRGVLSREEAVYLTGSREATEAILRGDRYTKGLRTQIAEEGLTKGQKPGLWPRTAKQKPVFMPVSKSRSASPPEEDAWLRQSPAERAANEKIYQVQDAAQEKLVHAGTWYEPILGARLPQHLLHPPSLRHVLEGTGDIFRETTKGTAADGGYIAEKVRRLKEFYARHEKLGERVLASEREVEDENIAKMLQLWKAQPTRTRQQALAKELNIALLEGRDADVKSVIARLESKEFLAPRAVAHGTLSTMDRRLLTDVLKIQFKRLTPFFNDAYKNSVSNYVRTTYAAKGSENVLALALLSQVNFGSDVGKRIKPVGTTVTQILDALRESNEIIAPEVYKVAKEMEARLAHMDQVEKGLFLLRSEIPHYMAHVASPEYLQQYAQELPASAGTLGFMRKLPSGRRRRVSSLIHEVNEAMKSAGKPEMFISDPSIAMMVRGAGHVRSVKYQEMVNTLTAKFGTELGTTVNPLTGRKVRVTQLTAEESKKFGILTVPTGTGVKHFKVPKDIAEYVNGYHRLVTNQETLNGLRATYRKVVNFYRGWTLGMFPAYHVRNVASNFMNNAISGMGPDDMGDYILAHKIAKYGPSLTDEFLVNDLGETISMAEFHRQMMAQAIEGSGQFGAEAPEIAGRTLAGARKLGLRPERAYEAGGTSATQSLLRSGRAARAGMPAPKNSATKILREIPFVSAPETNTALAYMFLVGRGMENNARWAQAIYSWKRGYGIQGARERVAKYLFDYNDINPTVKNLRDIFPFIIWTRKNIPMQLEAILKHPQFAAAAVHGKNSFERFVEADGLAFPQLPEFIRENVPISIGRTPDGTYKYFLLGNWLSTADLDRFLDPGQETINMLFPGIRLPFEAMSGYSFFFRNSIDRGVPFETRKFLGVQMSPTLAHVLRSFRPLAEANRLFGLDDSAKQDLHDRLLRYFMGMRTYDVDPEKEAMKRYRAWSEQLGRKLVYERVKRNR